MMVVKNHSVDDADARDGYYQNNAYYCGRDNDRHLNEDDDEEGEEEDDNYLSCEH